MSTKQPKSPSSKRSNSASSKPVSGTKPKRAADAQSSVPMPETVLRYSGAVICVVGLPKSVAEHLGPELTKAVLQDLNEISLHMYMHPQDDKVVVSLRAPIFATVL